MSRVARVVVGLLVGVVALAGCSTLADLDRVSSDIKAAGYDNVSVNHNTVNGHSVMEIEAARDDATAEEDADRIAELVWKTYPGEIDELRIGLNGVLQLAADSDELTSRFGERPDELGTSGSNVVTVVVILVCAAVFTAIGVLVWRRGRRPPPRPNLPYPPRYPPGAYPYGPPPQGH